jgi:RHS repeat-associated protein
MNLVGIERAGNPDHKFQYNGKERQTELGLNWMDYGARMYDAQIGRFHVKDRYAEKYMDFTPYQYGGNNPVLMIDINGDSLWINTGFRNLLYENGRLTTKSGKDVTHKAYNKKGELRKSFLGQSVGALAELSSTKAGAELVSGLQSSEFHYTIEQSSLNRFDPDNENNASAIMNLDPDNKHPFQSGDLWVQGMEFNQIGSGGTIYWDPNSMFNLEPSSLSLAHEMFHGFDSSRGILDRRFALGSGVVLGEEVGEIRAVYNTNLIRQQMGIKNLRNSYSDPNVSLLRNGSPINVEIKITTEMIKRFNNR